MKKEGVLKQFKTSDSLYIPRGEMCISCERKYKDCSSLDFQSMFVLERHEDAVIVVCDNYRKDKGFL